VPFALWLKSRDDEKQTICKLHIKYKNVPFALWLKSRDDEKQTICKLHIKEVEDDPTQFSFCRNVRLDVTLADMTQISSSVQF